MTAAPGPLLHQVIATTAIETGISFGMVESSVTSVVATIGTTYLDKVYRDAFDRNPPG